MVLRFHDKYGKRSVLRYSTSTTVEQYGRFHSYTIINLNLRRRGTMIRDDEFLRWRDRRRSTRVRGGEITEPNTEMGDEQRTVFRGTDRDSGTVTLNEPLF
jgi:hypothetical protein